MEAHRRAQLESVYIAHAGAVSAYARRRTDSASADDVVATVFAIAWRRLDELPDDVLPWLLACARRVLANQRRSERRRSALLARIAAQPGAPVAPSPHELHPGAADGTLLRALGSLSERDREVLMLVAWEGLPPARAAAVLGCSRGAPVSCACIAPAAASPPPCAGMASEPST